MAVQQRLYPELYIVANILHGKNPLGLYRYLPKDFSDWLVLEGGESLLLDGRTVLSEEVHVWY